MNARHDFLRKLHLAVRHDETLRAWRPGEYVTASEPPSAFKPTLSVYARTARQTREIIERIMG